MDNFKKKNSSLYTRTKNFSCLLSTKAFLGKSLNNVFNNFLYPKKSLLKSRDITLPTKVRLVKAMVFPVVMYGYENWTVKKAERRKLLNDDVEKTLESPLGCKEIQPVHPKGDQSWVFIGSTDAETETPILWPTHAKSLLIGKDPDAGRD